jgi:putative sigma-54 modulation protein
MKEVEEAEEEYQGKIVRTKRFLAKPMSPEEAVDQMELLGHSFFIFFNMDSNEFNVLYRRHDGDYGLLEPEVG